MLRYEPPPKDANSPFKNFPYYSNHSALITKANNARAHGARAMILVDLNRDDEAGEELLPTNSSLWRGDRSLVAAQVKRHLIETRLAARGIALGVLKKKIDETGKPASLPLPGLKVGVQVKLAEMHAQTDNVIGLLPGAAGLSLGVDNIVIGAHTITLDSDTMAPATEQPLEPFTPAPMTTYRGPRCCSC